MSETIEGEVIAIDLASGNYYSITGTGADIWELLSDSGPLGATEIVDALVHRFDESRPEIDRAVTRFIDELRVEGLIKGVDEGLVNGVESTKRQPPLVAMNNTPRRTFEPPRLETYTDMQDLVLIDPVHQVDDTGWPQARVDPSKPHASDVKQ